MAFEGHEVHMVIIQFRYLISLFLLLNDQIAGTFISIPYAW
jgi:hypothetical protein